MNYCNLEKTEALTYAGHSLRVGGTNFLRRMGLEEKLIMALGGWKTVVAERGYMQLHPDEQFELVRSMSVLDTRYAAFESSVEATSAMQQLQRAVV